MPPVVENKSGAQTWIFSVVFVIPLIYQIGMFAGVIPQLFGAFGFTTETRRFREIHCFLSEISVSSVSPW